MQTAEIRRRWLDFFAARDHVVVPSASLVSPDPSLLFTVAGMVPFIPYLTGQQSAPYLRATSVQKCVRTLDIEEVGKTTRHGTFFQMNGNFSFGDYFKAGAIAYAWELVTTPVAQGGYGFDPEVIWVTVYTDDDEAAALWREIAGLPPERIQRLGMEDNYWSTGAPGPAGPCSEIYVDRGAAYGPDGGPAADTVGDRYLEIWNLVFMQFQRGEGQGKDFPILHELPKKNIDTGMGLERVAFLLQGVDNMYEIDQVAPVLHAAADLAGTRYGAKRDDDVRLRVVADHVRAALMLMGDGVVPGNEGGGYVLRRLVRRAVNAMRLLGVDAATLPQLLPVSRDAMAPAYPELASDFARISQVAYGEEEAFRRTLAAGTTILDAAVARARSAKAHGGSVGISGEQAFALHDTYGFPIDLTLEMAGESGVAVDAEGFRRLMGEQRDRARADARAKRSGRADTTAYRTVADTLVTRTGRPEGAAVDFLGYDVLAASARVVGLLREGVSVAVALAGDDVEVILDRTPFYAESGGQLGDHGRLTVTGPTGPRGVLEVDDVQRPIPGLNVHHARVISGEVASGDEVEAVVDAGRRLAIARAHTATHLVHQSLRDALGGDTTRQAGSENAPGRMRFDFTATATAAPGEGVLADIEAEVNTVLADDLDVTTRVMGIDDARRSGALAFFGDKYGDRVRVVSIGEWSKELCGGTHVERSGQLGVVKLLGESSIGSGVRRIEALVGADAHAHLARESALVGQLTTMLKVRPDDLPGRIASLLDSLREADKAIAAVRTAAVLAGAGALARDAQPIAGAGGQVLVVATDAGEVASADDLRTLALDVRGRLGEAASVVAVAGTAGGSGGGAGKPVIVVATSPAARTAGIRAGVLVRVAAGVLGGGGGGKDDVAQGGGTDPAKVEAALAAVVAALSQEPR